MRYYSSEYRTGLKSDIIRAKESVDSRNYATGIKRVQVSVDAHNVLDECLAAAQNAQSRVNHAQERLNALSNELDKFYASTDEVANSVYTTALEINEIIEEANQTLLRLDDALNGVGKYEGKPVSVETLRDAGYKKERLIGLKVTTWDKITADQARLGYANEEMTAILLSRLLDKFNTNKVLYENEQSNIDSLTSQLSKLITNSVIASRVKYLPLLNDLYGYYVSTRYGTYGNAASMPEESRLACVSVYELLNPRAAQIMNKFFETVTKDESLDAEMVARNINIIKYDLYTAGSRERFLVLTYLPQLHLVNLEDETKSHYSPETDTLFLHMDIDCSEEANADCSFFHEFGHGLDDLLFDDEVAPEYGNSPQPFVSRTYCEDIIGDFLDDMRDVLGNSKELNKNWTKIKQFVMWKENVNVSYWDDGDYYKKLISDKSVENAYKRLREYFGYMDYIFDESGITYEPHEGIIDGSPETTVAGDLIGAMTNNKLGAVGDSHATVFDDSAEINSIKDLKNYLTNKSYWAKNKTYVMRKILWVFDDPVIDTRAPGTEFFAQSFDDRIHGVDQTVNKMLFPTAIDDFENTLNDACANADS